MIKILFLSLILLSGNAYADWTLVSTTTKGDEFFVDNQTLKREGASRRIWMMTNFGSPIDFSQQKVYSQKEFIEFNCAEDKARTLTNILYSEKNGQGAIIDRLTLEPTWSYPVPQTSFYTVAKKVCR